MAEQTNVATPVVYIPDNGRKKGSQKKNKRVANTVIYIVLVLISIIWIFPFIFIVLESFRVDPACQVPNPFFSMSGKPFVWGFDNYAVLFTDPKYPFGKWYLNTFIIALFTAVLQTIIVLCMSYTLSRSRFKGRKLLMNAMLVIGMFPGFLTMLVLYKVLSSMGLSGSNSVPGLILVYVASSGMGYHVSKGFFDTVPKALDEAARIDGANRAQVLYKIILPMAKPIVIYTVLTAFMAPWGDFVFASILAKADTDGYNVAVGLYKFISSKTTRTTKYTTFCAGGVLVSIPVSILFMFMQKYYVEGVTGGAVKG